MALIYWPTNKRLTTVYRYHSRQATLQVVFQRSVGLTKSCDKSPRIEGRNSHAIVTRPHILTPSINPKLGVSSQYKELHRCAL